MATDKECVDYARECVRLAGLSTDQQVRVQLLNIARDWMASALQEPKVPQAVSRPWIIELTAATPPTTSLPPA
jgi:hypothetical protein